MEAEKARSILTQARQDGTYEDPIPEEDAKAISEAEDLIQMAETAWKSHTRGPQVESLLRLAHENFDGGDDVPAPKDPDPEPEPEPAPEPDPLDEPDEGPELDTDKDWSAYEKAQPWDGYATDKVPDIIEGINFFAEQDDDVSNLLSHIWAYETAHKSRTRVIKHLEDMAAKIAAESGDNPEETPPVETEEPKAEVEPEPVETEDPAPSEEQETPAPVETESEPTPEEVPDVPDERVEEKEPDHAEDSGTDDWVPSEPEEATQESVEKINDLMKIPADETEKSPPDPDEKKHDFNPESDSNYTDLVAHVAQQMKRERLVIPEPPGDPLPEIPWDWTKMSDKELHRIYGAYSNAAYFKSYAVTLDDRMAKHCKDAADEMARELLIATEKYDHKGKEKKVTLIEAEIENDVNVKRWRKLQRKHEIMAATQRQERDSMNKLVESLSRMETMRRTEWEKAGK